MVRLTGKQPVKLQLQGAERHMLVINTKLRDEKERLSKAGINSKVEFTADNGGTQDRYLHPGQLCKKYSFFT